MKAAVLVYHRSDTGLAARVVWIDPFAGTTLHTIPVPHSPNVGLFPEHDCALMAYADLGPGRTGREMLDVYRISDWRLRARLPMDCRAHFNVSQRWSTYLPSPDGKLIYIYKAATLGDHRAVDYIGGLRLDTLEFTSWNYQIPECVAGWAPAGSRAHVQMLFIADGLETGQLPTTDLDQKVAFWLGPEEGMGAVLSLGPRPRIHSDLGHARAILFAPERSLSVVVCNDGTGHLIDAQTFRYLERQQVEFRSDHAMPIFAAQVDPTGRFLYVGTATHECRHRGLSEHVVVHDLTTGRRAGEWVLEEAFVHFALTANGRYLCGGGVANSLTVLDTQTGKVAARMQLDGVPHYVIPVVCDAGPLGEETSTSIG